MQDPKDLYFEFLQDDKMVAVERDRLISVEQIYPDDLNFPDANIDKNRCRICVEATDSELLWFYSTEKYEKLRKRLYRRFGGGLPKVS